MKTKNPRTIYIAPRTKMWTYMPEAYMMNPATSVDSSDGSSKTNEEEGDDWAASKRYNNGNFWDE